MKTARAKIAWLERHANVWEAWTFREGEPVYLASSAYLDMVKAKIHNMGYRLATERSGRSNPMHGRRRHYRHNPERGSGLMWLALGGLGLWLFSRSATPTPATGAPAPSGPSGILSGLSNLFAPVTGAIVSATGGAQVPSTTTPTPMPVQTQTGAVVAPHVFKDPATGQPATPQRLAFLSGISIHSLSDPVGTAAKIYDGTYSLNDKGVRAALFGFPFDAQGNIVANHTGYEAAQAAAPGYRDSLVNVPSHPDQAAPVWINQSTGAYKINGGLDRHHDAWPFPAPGWRLATGPEAEAIAQHLGGHTVAYYYNPSAAQTWMGSPEYAAAAAMFGTAGTQTF